MVEPLDGALEPIRLSSFSKQAENAVNSTAYPRQSFRRQPSSQGTPTGYQDLNFHNDERHKDVQVNEPQSTAGLGLGNVHALPQSIKRVPVGAKNESGTIRESPISPLTPKSSVGLFSNTTTAQNTPLDTSEARHMYSTPINKSSQYSQSEPFNYNPSMGASLLSSSNKPGLACPTKGDLLTNPWSWLTITILILAWYSSIFSGIFLGIALRKPRWGESIGPKGHISYAVATLLSAFFSKTIELSFVTVFVALLGQILSRRAFSGRKRTTTAGISIAEMTMRSWIVQPGTLFTHWSAVRYAALSIPGAMALVAAVAATFYTTAAEALVSPKLRFGPMEHKILAGKVSAAFANSLYLAAKCETPVSPLDDKEYRGTTCLQIEHAGQGFHNFQSYLSSWGAISANGNTSLTGDSLAQRPPPFAMLYDNTTVIGQWITPNSENITTDSKQHQRLVQNVTMAMPHANLVQAVGDSRNHILQPRNLEGSTGELQGFGEYSVMASVPVPAINVLCVGLSGDELKPLIHENVTLGPPYANATVVDDLFRFSESYGDYRQPAPYFPKAPLPYNTIVNASRNWGPDSVYLLATPPSTISTNEHVLCSVKAMQYLDCTTKYHVAEAGGRLEVHCDKDEENILSYSKSQSTATNGVWNQDWKDVGSEWIKAVALSQGVSDANASIARLVTQMIPAFNIGTYATSLDPSLPSIGEAIGVLAGCTLLLSSADAPFVHYWNYSTKFTSLEEPQYEGFNASVSYKGYASGGSQRWQGIFYAVLVAHFLLSCFALAYLTWRFCVDGQVTDYTEPANLFALAINSPPSTSMAGSCGAGPSGDVLAKKWQVGMDKDAMHEPWEEELSPFGRPEIKHPHFYIRCPEDEDMDQQRTRGSPKIKKRRSRPQSIQTLLSEQSPAVEQYERLSGW